MSRPPGGIVVLWRRHARNGAVCTIIKLAGINPACIRLAGTGPAGIVPAGNGIRDGRSILSGIMIGPAATEGDRGSRQQKKQSSCLRPHP
ncbi:hypothetical protein J6595_13970 [Jiella sp. KSK16Y-1]|uniref:Uncharacterized protein n=1 Tax=Jiella mangrovi TaxID=2821407 RepID=A0ABS4BIV9_9HYPH|nr:hypothetical protein [Jiella mangrovi]